MDRGRQKANNLVDPHHYNFVNVRKSREVEALVQLLISRCVIVSLALAAAHWPSVRSRGRALLVIKDCEI